MAICDGRVVIVTGAARGIGRAHALAFAAAGAKVVVNDLGVSLAGEGGGKAPADEVVAEIRAAGGEAFSNGADVADWQQTKALVDETLARFGRLDVVVNNAGFVRDRMFVSCGEDEWDAVLRVHLKGHFCLARHAAEHWRNESKAADGPVYGRIVNTASEAGIFGSPGQPNYASAKAAIISLTMVAANSLGRFGVNSNVIAPRARTRMTEAMPSFADAEVVDGFDPFGAEHIAPLVAYLASPAAEKVSGQLFVVHGRTISVIHGPFVEQSFESGAQWTPDEVASALGPFYDGRTPVAQGAQFQKDPR